MGPERRLHPSSFLFSMGRHLRALLLPAAAVIFTAGSSGRDWDLWLMLFLIPYMLAALARSLSFRYRFDADELVVRKGWVFRSERHIPYARIQNIDAVQNVLHRALGVAEVRVETASGGEPEATMTVLPVAALSEMRQFVFAGRQLVGTDTATAPAADDSDVILRLRTSEVLLYGFIESRGAVIMAGAFGVLWELGIFDRAFERATGTEVAGGGVFRQLLRAAIGQAAISMQAVMVTLLLFITLLLVLRMLSMAWAYVRLHGFVLRRRGDDLRVDYGLLTRVSGTIPLQRIQTLTVTESPLHRLFDRVSVHVDTAGGHGTEEQPRRREPIAPVFRRADLESLIAALVPSVALAAVEWRPAHPNAVRRARFRTGALATVVAGLAISVLKWWSVGVVVALAVWAWVYARKYVAHLGWALLGDAIVFRSGWLWRHLTAARFSKIQVVTRVESPFDRRTGMARVKVDTAGAATSEHRIDVPFLPAETATALATTLSARAAETAFRW
ncbi:MAG: PH domain-containing protein [Vicinamibacterales bacterium]